MHRILSFIHLIIRKVLYSGQYHGGSGVYPQHIEHKKGIHSRQDASPPTYTFIRTGRKPEVSEKTHLEDTGTPIRAPDKSRDTGAESFTPFECVCLLHLC